MSVIISSIATANPETSYTQEEIRDRMKHYLKGNRRTQAILHKIYKDSGIEKRHTVVEDFSKGSADHLFFHPDNGLLNPSTGVRNEIYEQEAPKLFTKIGVELLENSQVKPDEITHVITVSCTGFYAPGPDYELVKCLGLKSSVQRYHIGFMGCYAAFPAIRMAEAFCKADREATVLIIAVELCSLHFQISNEPDHLIGASVFADGGAGAIVCSDTTTSSQLAIDGFASTITEEGEDDMAWTIGDHGFEMILSSYVPKIIEANLQNAIDPLLAKHDLSIEGIDYWALHPGGRAIVDKVEDNLHLQPSQVAASRQVLRDYGNMSSATVLFVLKKLLEDDSVVKNERVYGLAFGPGLTVESGIFTKV